MMKQKIAVSLGMALLMSGYVGAQAAETPVYDLNPIVVTATRTSKAELNAPASTQVITGKEIKKEGYTSVYQAVTDLTMTASNHSYQEDGMNYGGMASRIQLRGLDTGTLVMVNGSPVNFANSSNLGGVPIDNVEKIEVVKGAGSVLYGPQAMAGVINIITKRPDGVEDGVHGDVYGSIGSRYKDGGVNVNTAYFNVGYKRYTIGDRDRVERPNKSGTGASLNMKNKKGEQLYLDGRLTDDLFLNYSYTNAKGDYEIGSFKKFKDKLNYVGRNDSTFRSYGLVWEPKDTGWRASVNYDSMLTKMTYGHPSPDKKTTHNDARYNGGLFNFDVQKKIDLNDGKDNLVLGGTIHRENFRNTKIYDPGSKNAGKRDSDSNGLTSYSLYQSFDHQFTDRYSMIFGMREYWLKKSKYMDSDFQWLPQVQGLYKLNTKSSLYFNVGKAFEMPGVNQFYSYSDNFVINTNLKPQSAWTYEFGYKFNDAKRELTADVFHMNVKNKFYFGKNDEGQTTPMNRDKWKNTGLEINFKQRLNDRWDFLAGATLQNPEAKSTKGKVTKWQQDSAKYIFSLGADYHIKKFETSARMYTYLKREWAYYNNKGQSSYSSFNSDHHLKDYWDLTISASYSPDKYDTIRLTGYNLFNRANVFNNYEYYSTPRRYVLTYERKF